MNGCLGSIVGGVSLLFAQQPPADDPKEVALAVGVVVVLFIGVLAVVAMLSHASARNASTAPAVPPPGASALVVVLPWTRDQAWAGGGLSLPSKLDALGEPDSVHRAGAWNKNSILSGAGTPPSDHVVFPDALVTLDGEQCGVFPWGVLDASLGSPFDMRWRLRTVDGVEFLVTLAVQDGDHLYETICSKLVEVNFPRLLPKLEQGEALPFGPNIAISRDGFVKGGRTLPWSDVSGLQITATQVGRFFRVTARGSFLPWANPTLDDMPNEPVILELVKRICPPHLLQSSPR